MRLAIVVADGLVGTHQRMLVSGIFLVEIHVRSPVCGGHASGLAAELSWSIDHGGDKPSQFDGREHGGESHVPRHGFVARRTFSRRDRVALGCAGVDTIHLFLVGGGVAAAF